MPSSYPFGRFSLIVLRTALSAARRSAGSAARYWATVEAAMWATISAEQRGGQARPAALPLCTTMLDGGSVGSLELRAHLSAQLPINLYFLIHPLVS